MKKYIKLFIPLCGLLVLIIPLFHINTAEITEQENRMLAKFPGTKKKDKPNYEFGKEFETWLGDRFWGRDRLIDASFQTMYKINGRIENDKAFVGDDGWMFMKNGIVNVPSLEKQREEIEQDADILKRFDDKFKEKNIPIYLVLIPDRNQLYQKYWEKYYTPKPRLDYGDELIKALKDHPNIHIIYPKEEFMEAMKNDNVYFKEDAHLNIKGKEILVKTILKRLLSPKEYNKLHIISDFQKKRTASYIALSLNMDIAKLSSTITCTPSNAQLIERIKPNYKKGDSILLRYYHESANLNKLFFIGTCYMITSLGIWTEIFQDSSFLRINHQEQEKVLEQLKKHDFQNGETVIMIYHKWLIENLQKLLED